MCLYIKELQENIGKTKFEILTFSLQEQAAEEKQRRSAAAAKEKIISSEGNGEPSINNNAATSTEISEHENEVQNDNWPVDCIKCNISLDTLENFNQVRIDSLVKF